MCRTATPDAALARCIDFIESISRRAAYLALLQQYPHAIGRVADLVGASRWAAQYLTRHPILLDELLNNSDSPLKALIDVLTGTVLKDVLAEIAPDAIESLPPEEESIGRYERMINVKDRGQIFRVDVDSIEHIEAAGDYMCIYTGDNSLILRQTMKDLERRLDPRIFQRVHRSTIVNLDKVRQVKPHTNGECFLSLESGAQVKVSRSYRDVVARFVH